jgi:hypothetical protein
MTQMLDIEWMFKLIDFAHPLIPVGLFVAQPSDPELGATSPAFGTPEYYRTCGWNLNNISVWPGSAIRCVTHSIDGINKPWLVSLFLSIHESVFSFFLFFFFHSLSVAGHPSMWCFCSPAHSCRSFSDFSQLTHPYFLFPMLHQSFLLLC